MFSKEQIEVLNSQLNSSRIKVREKGNIKLSYIEGFDVIETANSVFGFGNWSYDISKLDQVSQETNTNQNVVICCKAIVKLSVYDENHLKSISRQDVGFGTGVAKTLSDAHENAGKEAVTDALKRAMRSFGNQFGNSLYDKSKNHQSHNINHPHNQTHQIPANNMNQPQTYNQTKQSPQNTAAYQYQQDFPQLTNLGLNVVQQGDSLIVVGDNVFANKDTIKSNGFRWDGPSKTWYMPLRQAA